MTTVEYTKHEDRWQLHLTGQQVTRCCFDYSAVSLLSSEGIEFRLERPFTYREANGSPHTIRPESAAPALLAPVLQVRFQILRHVTAFTDGRLQIVFENGREIEVLPDQRYEAWNIVGPHFWLVSLPGGGLG
jgi:hypothetical protein